MRGFGGGKGKNFSRLFYKKRGAGLREMGFSGKIRVG
tara:strand:- start:818 stop:928 length:111 start_codon:yes stop_codon:yes gene_type:complete